MKEHEIPRIKITDIDKIRILVCHLIYSIGVPLNRKQLIEITSLEDAVNYFDLSQALDTIGERLCVITEEDGEPVYANTKLGDAAAKEFGVLLPVSVREKMFEEAVRVYTRDATHKNSLYAVRYAESEDGICTVGITIRDENTRDQKYYLSVSLDDKAQAEKIKAKMKNNPSLLKDCLDKFFE